MPNIGVYIELKNNLFKKSNKEALGVARRSGKNVTAVIFSSDLTLFDNDLKGIARVIQVKEDTYDPVGCAETVAKIIKDFDLTDFIGICSARGKDLFPRIAARLDDAALINDCIDINLEKGCFTKPVYAGKLLSNLTLTSRIRMITLRPNVFPAQEDAPGSEPEKITVEPVQMSAKSKILEIVKSGSKRIDLTEAEIIVSGGRGIKTKENFGILEELADVLGAAVGASRAAVDAEYATYDMQVGQTGKVVNPKLYIACGISGAIQHFVGMKTSKVIVAINKDSEAPIFKKADYGIIGDLFKIIPMITTELKK